MKIGLQKVEITPRTGVELQGYGPFLNRCSNGVYDPLFARAMAVEAGGRRVVLASCDLIGVSRSLTRQVQTLVGRESGLPADHIMVHATHTHSGPSLPVYSGWGTPDPPYLEILPGRIAQACVAALSRLRESVLAYAATPCAGVAINREYDAFQGPSIDEVLRADWRPAKPEETDAACQVFKIETDGRVAGFISYFGCHPVVGGPGCRKIHGDFAGVATHRLEKLYPGSVGLFLQGAQGDINTGLVCSEEDDALRALDVLANRYAAAVQAGLQKCRPLKVDTVLGQRLSVKFSRKLWSRRKLRELLTEQESILHAPQARDADYEVRLAAVRALALRRMLEKLAAGESLEPSSDLHGLRVGPVALLGAPFEIFRAIKNEVVQSARAEIPLVMGFTDDSLGYAVDRVKAAQGGYAADLAPLICQAPPFARIHDGLVAGLLALDRTLAP